MNPLMLKAMVLLYMRRAQQFYCIENGWGALHKAPHFAFTVIFNTEFGFVGPPLKTYKPPAPR